MIEIDGSLYSGSGTLLRYAVALATLKRQPLHIFQIRARRPKPGLRAQHLQAVLACSKVSGGKVEGASIGSDEIFYWPGERIRSGEYHFDIGTAGSATMTAFTLIPMSLFADGPCTHTITGGLFQDFAPSFFHMQKLLIPLIRSMGADVTIEMIRPGYVPQGGGKLKLSVKPIAEQLKPIKMIDRGSISAIKGIALASHLADQRVAQRMAEQCRTLLKASGFVPDMEIMEESQAPQKGAALLLWAETNTGCLIGSDQAGKPGRRSEAIADFVVRALWEDLDSGATVDRHLADQLILFAALAEGTSEYKIPMITDHVESNLWLVETILGVRSKMDRNLLLIRGKGWRPS